MQEVVNADNMAKLVEECFSNALYGLGKEDGKPISVDGITRNALFHEDRLKKHSVTILAILRQLPKKFKEGTGFERMAYLRDGRTKWTRRPYVCEQLLLMAVALGLMKYKTERDREWKFEGSDIPEVAITA